MICTVYCLKIRHLFIISSFDLQSFLLLSWSWRPQDFIIRFHFAVILIQFGNYFKISFYERRIIRGAEFLDDNNYTVVR